MKVFIKGLNVCVHRRQNLLHHKVFLEKYGHDLVKNARDADVILVWGCGFREDVVENTINELDRYKKEYKGEVVALGCLPDIDRKQLQKRFDGRIVAWKKEGEFFEEYFNAPKGSFKAATPVFHENALCKDAAEYRRLHPDEDALFADEFFKLMISQGCPYECTYCTEKLAFPPVRSVSEDDLVEACRIPVEQQGQNKIILIGDCLGQYGSDINSSLPQLIRRLHSEYPQTVYALQNFHPIDFLRYYDDIKQFIKDKWLIHINLPVQSASDKILTKMKRQYNQKDLDKVFGLLQEMNFKSFDTHIIVGFPSETEKDFMETVQFLKRYTPKYALVSKYYDAPGTWAAKMDEKVPDSIMMKRLKTIEKAMKEANMIYNIDGTGIMSDRLERINKQGE